MANAFNRDEPGADLSRLTDFSSSLGHEICRLRSACYARCFPGTGLSNDSWTVGQWTEGTTPGRVMTLSPGAMSQGQHQTRTATDTCNHGLKQLKNTATWGRNQAAEAKINVCRSMQPVM